MEGMEMRNFLLGYLSKDIAKTKVVVEDVRLIMKAKQGDRDAIRKVIENNIRLVVKFASKFRVQSDVFMDLISEGCLGIMRAIKKYDVSKNVKFSSYASLWIKHNILEYLSRNSSVKLPSRKKKVVRDVKRRMLCSESNDSFDEILNCNGVSVVEYQILYALDNIVSFSDLSEDIQSLENALPSKDVLCHKVENDSISALISEKLSKLSPKEQFVLEHKYGLNNKELKSLSDLARIFNSTPEGIRYVERKALKKLKVMLENEGIVW
ncbi:MAG: sigma-70 family RNA polymerase sigma factor [Brevinematia bacterium]